MMHYILPYILISPMVLLLFRYALGAMYRDSQPGRHVEQRMHSLHIAVLVLASFQGLVAAHPSYALAGWLACYVLALWVLPRRLSHTATGTVPECLGRHYGPTVRLGAAWLSVIYLTLLLAYHLGRIHFHTSALPEGGFTTALCILCFCGSATVWRGMIVTSCWYELAWLAVVPLVLHVGLYSLAGSASTASMWVDTFGSGWLPWVSPWAYLWMGTPALGQALLVTKDFRKLRQGLLLGGMSVLAVGIAVALYRLQVMHWKMPYHLHPWYHIGSIVFHLSPAIPLLYLANKLVRQDLLGVATPSDTSGTSQVRSLGVSLLLLASALAWRHYLSAYQALWLSRSFLLLLSPLQLAFLASLHGVKSSKKALYGALGTIWVLQATALLWLSDDKAVLISAPAGLLAFVIGLGMSHGKEVWVRRSWKEARLLRQRTEPALGFFSKLGELLSPHGVMSQLQRSLPYGGITAVRFAIFFILASHLAPLFLTVTSMSAWRQPIGMVRNIGLLLALGLGLQASWPRMLVPYLGLYWQMTLTYCLPCMGMLWFLLQPTSYSLVQLALALMLLRLLVTSGTFVLSASIGMGLAIAIAERWIPQAAHSWEVICGDYQILYMLLYVVGMIGCIGAWFFTSEKAHTEQSLDRLSLFGKTMFREMNNTVGMQASYINMLELCSQAMELQSEDSSHVVLRMDKTSYESMQHTFATLNKVQEQHKDSLRLLLRATNRRIDTKGFAHYSAADCLKEALEHYYTLRDRYYPITTELEEDFTFWGDPKHFNQMIANLLKNTEMFTPAGTPVKIWLSKRRLYYQDQGPGIATEHLPHLFTPYYTTRQDAVGLGLTYVARVMRTFGGRVQCVSSSYPDKATYTRFVLTFEEHKAAEPGSDASQAT